MNAAFLAAANPRPHTVLTLRLRPLCIGHWFLMQAHDCATAHGREASGFDDLLLSSFICSQAPSESEKDINKRLSLFLFLRFLSFRARKLIWIIEARKFSSYIVYHRQMPSVSLAVHGRQMGSQEHWRLFAMLMKDFGMTKREALDTDFLTAHCLWAVEGERGNNLSVVSDDECAVAREIAKEMRNGTV